MVVVCKRAVPGVFLGAHLIFYKGETMEIGLIKHIIIKFGIIEMYEGCPQTEAVYLRKRKRLERRLEELKKEYKETAQKSILTDIESIKIKMSDNISPLAYKLAKEDIELHKARYIGEIPEEHWNQDSFIKIYFLMQNGGIPNVQEAIRYIDTY